MAGPCTTLTLTTVLDMRLLCCSNVFMQDLYTLIFMRPGELEHFHEARLNLLATSVKRV